MSGPRRFVFCLAGEGEHPDRLARAVAALAPRTAAELVVVVDPRRTGRELPPVARRVEVETPVHLSHRAAVIWMKTRLAALLSNGTGCYLDTDLTAVGSRIDEIFDLFVPPVTFASDLTSPRADLRTFSSHAVRCPCHEERERLGELAAAVDDLTAFHRRCGAGLARLADEALYRQPRFRGRRLFLGRGPWWTGTATGASADGVSWTQSWRRGRLRRCDWSFAGERWSLVREGTDEEWRDDAGRCLAWRTDPATVEGGFWESSGGDSLRRLRAPEGEELWWFAGRLPRRRWQPEPASDHGGLWLDSTGADLGRCDHLAETVERALGVAIGDRGWVPWNGGVFLFSGCSAPFLESWWRDCERLWRDSWALERDQGALVATAWRSGLADHPRLPARFNWIVPPTSRPEPDLSGDVQFVHRIGGLSLGDGSSSGARG